MSFSEEDEATGRGHTAEKLERLDIQLQEYGNRLEQLRQQLEKQVLDNTPRHRRWLMKLRLFVRRWGLYLKHH